MGRHKKRIINIPCQDLDLPFLDEAAETMTGLGRSSASQVEAIDWGSGAKLFFSFFLSSSRQ